jgi:Schlafen, AlbA_2
MLKKFSIEHLINAGDPLSESAIKYLLEYKEEDVFVDYKESFENSDGKQWIGITSDIMAFANTLGGYLVFGVRDGDFEIVGIDEETISILTDTNLILQKINRFILPQFVGIRSKKYKTDKGTIVVLYIPESKGKTHIYVKDANHRYPKGKTITFVNAGTIFIRRSATNNIVDPDDLEYIINKRIDFYKESILSRISKVIEAPSDHQVLIFDPESKSESSESYVISDSPDAIPVKGMSFSIVPNTDLEEISGWIALSKRDPFFQPSHERLWHHYLKRKTLKLNLKQKSEMVKFSLKYEVPVFFWLKEMAQDVIKQALIKNFDSTKNIIVKSTIIKISVYLGKTFFNRIVKKISTTEQHRINYNIKIFPKRPESNFHESFIEILKGPRKDFVEIDFKKKIELELDKIAADLSNRKATTREKTESEAFDCYLYSRQDKYINK